MPGARLRLPMSRASLALNPGYPGYSSREAVSALQSKARPCPLRNLAPALAGLQPRLADKPPAQQCKETRHNPCKAELRWVCRLSRHSGPAAENRSRQGGGQAREAGDRSACDKVAT